MKNGIIFLLIISGIMPLRVLSQEGSLLSKLKNGEKEAVEAIALYPEKERIAILEAAMHPEILVRMQNIRRNTEENFQILLADLSKDKQEMLFDLARYPELVQSICVGGKKKSESEMTELLSTYPDDLAVNARFVNRKLFSSLQEINTLYNDSELAFTNVISKYPEQTQSAYRELLLLPEIVSVLNEYMSITVLIGDIYKNNPEEIVAELDAMNVLIAEQKTKELAEWKQSLEENPEALEEYEKSVQDFAEEQGYDYSQTTSVQYTTEIYQYHVWRPYSYWFGPPWWYSYDYWYPYPWWYHCGYYYGPSNGLVFVGLPSYYYVDWHMQHHHHFYHYPHFTDHMFNYYYGHRNSVTSITVVTEKWMAQNKSEFPENWFANDARRVQRFKEYGKFKMDYEKASYQADIEALSQREFLERNADKYPSLKPVLKDKQNPIYSKPKKEEKYVPKVQKEYKVPEKRTNDKLIEKPTTPQRVDRARDYHNETWKKTKTEPKKNPPPVQRKNKPVQKKKIETTPKQQPKKVPVKRK